MSLRPERPSYLNYDGIDDNTMLRIWRSVNNPEVREAAERVQNARGNFTFADAEFNMILPWYKDFDAVEGSDIIRMRGLTLITISEHRDHFPVTSLGNVGIKGFTSGHQTTAGSLGFITQGDSAFSEALLKYNWWANGRTDFAFTSPSALPVINIIGTLVNDQGHIMTLYLKSVKIADSGRTIGVQDVQLTEVYSYQAAEASIYQLVL